MDSFRSICCFITEVPEGTYWWRTQFVQEEKSVRIMEIPYPIGILQKHSHSCIHFIENYLFVSKHICINLLFRPLLEYKYRGTRFPSLAIESPPTMLAACCFIVDTDNQRYGNRCIFGQTLPLALRVIPSISILQHCENFSALVALCSARQRSSFWRIFFNHSTLFPVL